MTETFCRRKTCRLCRGELELVLPLPATPPGDHYVHSGQLNEAQELYSLDIVLCRDCGLAQLACTVAPDILYAKFIYVSSISLGLVEHFRGYAAEVVARARPAPGSLVIDIGSNDGSLLRAFQEQGVKALGVDPAAEIARQATEAGVETVAAYFTPDLARALRARHGAASIVTANNVTANVDDLEEFMLGIRHLLDDDGVLVVETSYLLDVVQKSLIETVFHEHLSYFSVKPLEAFFRRIGMQLIDVRRVPTKGGSIRCLVQRAEGSRKPSPSVAELIAFETAAGLHRPETFEAFAEKLKGVKKKLRQVLGDLKARGNKIAGYGASVGVTTLLYLFDLGDQLDFLTDDNPRKQHTFSPGQHIPVLPPEALYDRGADYVLILAWNYAAPIMKKHRMFAERGGRFILPLPEVEVL